MRKTLLLIAALCMSLVAMAQADQTPALKHVLDLHVKISGAINVGKIPAGTRLIIPITGGTFDGPEIRGEVVAGGADYQLGSANAQITEVNAIYSIRTDDGVDIFVNNKGIITGEGASWYFFTAPHFEAPVDSKYAWLNTSIFVCRPVGFGDGEIHLRVWRVCDANE